MVLLTIISIAAFVLSVFYLIGFWSAKVAGQVELILLAIAHLELKHQKTLKIPNKIALPIKKFVLDLVHKRRLHAARREAKRELKKLLKKSR